jgi:hypothetical protein
VILTASMSRIYVNCQVTNVKLPDDDIEMWKHVVVYIISRYSRDIYDCDINGAVVGYNKNSICLCLSNCTQASMFGFP